MINYSKYALMFENRMHEATQFTMNTPQGIAKVLSGKDYAMYQNQWNQFVDMVTAKKKEAGSGDKTSTAVISHDDGRTMVAITYDIKGGKLDWMSLRCGVPSQYLSKTYTDYKGLSSTFKPDATLDGSSSQPAPEPSPAPTDAGQAEYSKVAADSETLVDLLDTYTTEAGMKEIYDILAKYNGKKVKNSNGKVVDALGLLSFYYADNESGDQLWRDVTNVGVATWTYSGGGKTNKENAEKILKPYQNETMDTLKTKYFD